MFNKPRAGVNVNDGFYGNHTISWNVMFNTVRETSDHGPINSWDRQPYLIDAAQPGSPSLWQHTSYIHHNTLVNNYRSVWSIDHDDGSCFYEDSYNFQIYGSKNNLMGHSKMDHHEIYVYPNLCILSFGSGRRSDAFNESWMENICALHRSSTPYSVGCNTADLFVPYLANNTIYTDPGVNIGFQCIANGTSTLLSLQQ